MWSSSSSANIWSVYNLQQWLMDKDERDQTFCKPNTSCTVFVHSVAFSGQTYRSHGIWCRINSVFILQKTQGLSSHQTLRLECMMYTIKPYFRGNTSGHYERNTMTLRKYATRNGSLNGSRLLQLAKFYNLVREVRPFLNFHRGFVY